MKTIAHVLLAAIVSSGLLALRLHAEEQLQRYIVVLKQRSGAVPDVASLGGKIEFRQDDQLVVTIPPGALTSLKADPKVRYVERVGGTPSDDETPLIGVPSDPQPGPSTQAARLTPHALGTLSWDSGNYAYDGAGNIVSIDTDNYLYDGAQRLKQSSTKGTSETYTYDGFGNMTGKSNNGQTQIVPAVEAATNRYIGSGYTYTEAGAVKTDGSYAFSYDALGQPLSKIYNGDNSKLEYYVYTPSDERIGVQRAGWWTWSVRDEGGKVLRQYKSSSTNPSAPALWLEDFVWRDGLLLGSQRPVEMGGRRHFHLDHLGSPRLITADNGQMVSYHDYYPFGDEHSPVWQEGPSAGGFDREEPMKFTGHERDYASGMGGEDGHAIDDMHARYYGPSLGRFLSVDPVLGDPHVPQSLNRYVYVRNNTMLFNDPKGRAVALSIFPSGGWIDNVWNAVAEATEEHRYYDVVWKDEKRLRHEGIYLVNTRTGTVLSVWEHNIGWSKPHEGVQWKASLAYNTGWTPASAKDLGREGIFGFSPKRDITSRLNKYFASRDLQCTDYCLYQQHPIFAFLTVLLGPRASTGLDDHKAGVDGYGQPSAVLPAGFPK